MENLFYVPCRNRGVTDPFPEKKGTKATGASQFGKEPVPFQPLSVSSLTSAPPPKSTMTRWKKAQGELYLIDDDKEKCAEHVQVIDSFI